MRSFFDSIAPAALDCQFLEWFPFVFDRTRTDRVLIGSWMTIGLDICPGIPTIDLIVFAMQPLCY